MLLSDFIIEVIKAGIDDELRCWYAMCKGDDPKPHDMVRMCMIFAAIAGRLRSTYEPEVAEEASVLLGYASRTARIPYSVLDAYASFTAALYDCAFQEYQKEKVKTGGQND